MNNLASLLFFSAFLGSLAVMAFLPSIYWICPATIAVACLIFSISLYERQEKVMSLSQIASGELQDQDFSETVEELQKIENLKEEIEKDLAIVSETVA